MIGRRKQCHVDTGMTVYILFPTTSQCLFLLTMTALVYGGSNKQPILSFCCPTLVVVCCCVTTVDTACHGSDLGMLR